MNNREKISNTFDKCAAKYSDEELSVLRNIQQYKK